jgi:hypothetical protein
MNWQSESLAPWFVWTVWIVALTAMLTFALSYKVNMPWADEWDYAPIISGVQPVSFQFFWEQHNEHRVPLPKLIWLFSLRVSHFDFRTLSFLHILAFGALSAAFIAHAKSLRGTTRFTDAFFPLLFLSPAHYQNFLWAWQINFILPVILISVLLLLMIRTVISGSQITWSSIALAGTCLIFLPLCGAVGVVFAPALSSWWLYVALRPCRSSEQQHKRKIVMVLVTELIALSLVILYLHGLQRPSQIQATPGVSASLRTMLEFFSGSFGYHAGLRWPSVGPAILALIAGSMLVPLMMSRREQTRLTSIGLLLFLGAATFLGFGVGWGRAGLGLGAGLQPRYVTLMVPALICVYFVWVIYSFQTVSRSIHIALFAVASILLPISVREALAFRQLRVHQMEAFESDLMRGIPLIVLAQRHTAFLDHFADAPERGAESMRLFQRVRADLRTRDNVAAVHQPAMVTGTLDHVSEDQIVGWAWDRADPNSSVQVEILDGDKVLDTVDAVMFREDLLEAHIGSGHHSFSYLPPASLADGNTHKVRAVVKGTGVELQGSPKTLLATPEKKLLASPAASTTGGSFDLINDEQIAGWAWDRSRPRDHVQVNILDGETVLATVDAVRFRQDLFDARIGHGDYAFTHPLPAQLKDGKPHGIRLIVAGTDVELTGSPKTFMAKR